MNTKASLSTRAWVYATQLRARSGEDRGDISGNIVWAAGIVLIAIVVVGILAVTLRSGAESIDVSPGI